MIEGHRGSIICLDALALAVEQACEATEPFDCTMCRRKVEPPVKAWRSADPAENVDPDAAICWDCIQQADRSFDRDPDTDWQRKIAADKNWSWLAAFKPIQGLGRRSVFGSGGSPSFDNTVLLNRLTTVTTWSGRTWCPVLFTGPEADRYEHSSGEARSGNTLMGINHPISVTASRPRESMVNHSIRQEVSMDWWLPCAFGRFNIPVWRVLLIRSLGPRPRIFSAARPCSIGWVWVELGGFGLIGMGWDGMRWDGFIVRSARHGYYDNWITIE